MDKKIKIAICGTRGVPARYGGFETFAEQLGSRLHKKGHEVVVYSRYYSDDESYKNLSNFLGMELKHIKAVRHKYLETPLHTFFSFIDLYKNPVDIVLLCNAANSIFAWMPFLRGMPVVINVDGIERIRRKWNFLGRTWYFIGEMCSVLFGSSLISDANYIREYYLDRYARDSNVIRYGARMLDSSHAESKISNSYDFLANEEVEYLQLLNLRPGEYLLYVSRLEPENNADKVIEAYKLIPEEFKKKYPLVIVGDAPYSDEFKKSLFEHKSESIRFLGYRFDKEYETLQKAARIYFQATEVGGTHPALVEAMGYANCIIANEVPEHREVVDSVAVFYKKNCIVDMACSIKDLLENPHEITRFRKLAYDRARSEYSWDSVCSQYEKLFENVLNPHFS